MKITIFQEPVSQSLFPSAVGPWSTRQTQKTVITTLNRVMVDEEEWEGKSAQWPEWHDGEMETNDKWDRKKSRVRHRNNNNNKKNPQGMWARRANLLQQLWDYQRQGSRWWVLVMWVCVCVRGQLCIPPPPSLYPLRWPWWDTTFHLLIAVIGVCEGEVHVFCSPSASVRESENGILWRAVCVCLPHPRWHIFIIRSGTEQISLSSGHQHTLWFTILKVI